MKVKSSVVLTQALALIEAGKQDFVCAVILDVETEMRWDSGENIISKAQKVFDQFKPDRITRNASIMEWWPKKSPERIEALNKAIAVARKSND